MCQDHVCLATICGNHVGDIISIWIGEDVLGEPMQAEAGVALMAIEFANKLNLPRHNWKEMAQCHEPIQSIFEIYEVLDSEPLTSILGPPRKDSSN